MTQEEAILKAIDILPEKVIRLYMSDDAAAECHAIIGLHIWAHAAGVKVLLREIDNG